MVGFSSPPREDVIMLKFADGGTTLVSGTEFRRATDDLSGRGALAWRCQRGVKKRRSIAKALKDHSGDESFRIERTTSQQ